MPLIVNNSTTLDIDGVDMPLNFSVADMKNPAQRKSSSSKTIKLPGTSTNLLFFQTVYNLSATDIANSSSTFSFDPRIRVEARYEENGITLFDGLLQILKAVKEDGYFTFEAVLFSDVLNIVKELDKISLPELGWAEYDHVLDKILIRNAWDTSVEINTSNTSLISTQDYIEVFDDFKNGVIADGGTFENDTSLFNALKPTETISNFTGGIPDGFGYIYSFADYGLEYPSNSERYQKTNQLKVGVYFREILKKAMDNVGKDYEFTLNNTELFKRMTLFNEGGEQPELSSAEIEGREVEKTDAIDRNVFIPFSQGVYLKSEGGFLSQFFDSVIFEDFNTVANGKIQVNRQGFYKISFDATVYLSLVGSGDLADWNQPSTIGRRFNLFLTVNGINVQTLVFATFPLIGSAKQEQQININQTAELNLQQGDIIDVRYVLQISTTNNSETSQTLEASIESKTDTQTTKIEAIEGEIVDGSTVNVSRFLPTMKVSDWYKSFMRMFNLYQFQEEDGTIKLIPAKDFYSGTTNAENWTQKLDHSMPIEIEPPNRIEGKFYNAKWADETDYWNQRYFDLEGEQYGSNIFDVGDTWQRGTVDLEVGFAQSVPTEVDGHTTVIMPRIYKQDDEVVEPYKGKAPRIFIYNGMVTIDEDDYCALYPSDGNFQNVLFLENSTDYVQPQFHHTLDLSDPKFDLNFKQPNQVFYNGTITNKNLWSDYWKTFIEEITSADAKILTAYFKLSKLDIKQLDFGKLKNIDGVVYRLNVVEEYISKNNITTRCELIKVIKGDSLAFIVGIPGLPDKKIGLIETPPDDDSSGTGVISGGFKVEKSSNIIFG